MVIIQDVLSKLNSQTFADADRVADNLSTRDGLITFSVEATRFSEESCPVLNSLLELIVIPYYGEQAWFGAVAILVFLVRLSRTDTEVRDWLAFTVEKFNDPSYISGNGKLVTDLEQFSKNADFLAGNLIEEVIKCQNLQRCFQRLAGSRDGYVKMLMGIIAMLAILNSPHDQEVLVLQE